MNWETILCLGDSITIGARSYLGYPEFCGDFLSKETNKTWNVINHATSGFTTIDLVRSVDKNYAHLKTTKPDIATILIGTNDLKSKTKANYFTISYNLIVAKAQLIVGNKNIILIKIPKLMNNVMLPYNIEMNKMVDEYNIIIENIAKEKGINCFELNYDEHFFYDGVHLNDEGSEKIGKQIADCILKFRRQ